MNRLALAILAGGLIAGVLDIIYAFIVYGPLSYSERLTRAFSTLRPADPDHPWMLPATVFTHTVLVGLPIALSAKRFAS